MKKIFVFSVMIMSMVLLLLSPVLQAKETESQFSVIEKYISKVNTKQWEETPSFWIESTRQHLDSFVKQENNKLEYKGLFNIDKAKISDWKELSPEDAAMFTAIPEEFNEIKYYYVAIDYSVHNENKHYLNGLNYVIAAVVNEYGEWKIAQLSNLPLDYIVSNKLGFNTDDELEMSKILDKRKQGEVFNKNGKLLQKLDGIEAQPDVKTNSLAILIEPSYIDVYMSSSTNRATYCGGGTACVPSLNFNVYIKNVLPNEWGITSAWKDEALRAGAMAVKMYGWYATMFPLASAVGADIYDDTRSQVFIIGTAESRTTCAINYIAGTAIVRHDNNQIFLTEFRKGSYDSTTYKYSGIMGQEGTRYLADNSTSDWFVFCQWYYNFSTRVGGGTTDKLFY